MATKKQRELIWAKYGGRCAYCGCELTKGWHIDELLPIRRRKKWDKTKRAWVFAGACKHPERLHIDNQMPACASCNINKHAMSLEEFRQLIGGFLKSLNRDSTQYKIAKRYGFIEEVDKPVVFYFETYQPPTPNCDNCILTFVDYKEHFAFQPAFLPILVVVLTWP